MKGLITFALNTSTKGILTISHIIGSRSCVRGVTFNNNIYDNNKINNKVDLNKKEHNANYIKSTINNNSNNLDNKDNTNIINDKIDLNITNLNNKNTNEYKQLIVKNLVNNTQVNSDIENLNIINNVNNISNDNLYKVKNVNCSENTSSYKNKNTEQSISSNTSKNQEEISKIHKKHTTINNDNKNINYNSLEEKNKEEDSISLNSKESNFSNLTKSDKIKFKNNIDSKLNNTENINLAEENHLNNTYKIDKINEKQFKATQSAVPSSSFSRAMRFSWLGISMISSALPGAIKSKLLNEENNTFKKHLINKSNSEKLSKTLCKMRGAALKFGQILSTFEDIVVPESIRKALEKARQEANAMPHIQLIKTLNNDLGNDWESKFKEFNTEPFAAASIGQVHKALINSNDINKNNNLKKVAVKIQFPGVAKSIESDLNNLKRIFNYLNIIPKGMYIDKLIDNLGKEIKEECNYKLEAERQEYYKKLIKYDNKLNKTFVVPSVINELSTNNILTSEFVEGNNVDEIDNQSQEIRDYIGERLLELCLREIFIHRFMQTDPNPANFFVNFKDNKHNIENVQIGLIDFGAARDYDKKFVDTYMKIVYYASLKNKDKVLEHSKELGFLIGLESELMLNAHANSVFAIAEPFSNLFATDNNDNKSINKEQLFDFGNQTVTKKIYKELPIMLKHRLTSPPTEVYSLHRRLSGAYLMCIKLKSKVKSFALFSNIVEEYKIINNINKI